MARNVTQDGPSWRPDGDLSGRGKKWADHGRWPGPEGKPAGSGGRGFLKITNPPCIYTDDVDRDMNSA